MVANGIVPSMFRVLRLVIFFSLVTGTAEAQGDLSDLFSILRTEGPSLSESGRARTFQILEPYGKGTKSLDGEWQTLNDALSDSSTFVRDQACAVLATIVSVNSTPVYLNPPRPIRLPDETRALVIQRFSESQANLRENAVHIIASMAGGVPPSLASQLLQMARTDPASQVRRVAIGALASIRTPNPEITEFWVQSLKSEQDTALRGMVLNAFRFYAQTDPTVISLVIDALKDSDYYVRQEAISAVIKIGKPASAALILLNAIRDASASGDERNQAMRMNAEAAIRILSKE